MSRNPESGVGVGVGGWEQVWVGECGSDSVLLVVRRNKGGPKRLSTLHTLHTLVLG